MYKGNQLINLSAVEFDTTVFESNRVSMAHGTWSMRGSAAHRDALALPIGGGGAVGASRLPTYGAITKSARLLVILALVYMPAGCLVSVNRNHTTCDHACKVQWQFVPAVKKGSSRET